MAKTAWADAASCTVMTTVNRRDAHSSDQGHSPGDFFKILDGTEPTVSMPMLVANGNKVVFRGEDAELITAKGETAPLTSEETIGT